MTRLFRVGHDGSLSAVPLLHAKIQGYFESEGLQIDVIREFGSRSLINRCTDQRLDAACLPALAPIVQSIHTAQDPLRWSVLKIVTRNGYGIILSPAATQRLSRLKFNDPLTLRIGIPPTTTCAPLIIRSWFRTLGNLGLSETKLSPLPQSEMLDFLVEDVVDGFCAPEPLTTLAVEKKLGHLVAESHLLHPSHLNAVVAAPPGSPLAGTSTRKSFDRALDRALRDCAAGWPPWLATPTGPHASLLPDIKTLMQLRQGPLTGLQTTFAFSTTPTVVPLSSDHTFLEECCMASPRPLPHPRLLRKTITEIYSANEVRASSIGNVSG